jgi:hypothetical protein
VPEQRAARKNADFFMRFGLGLAVKKGGAWVVG